MKKQTQIKWKVYGYFVVVQLIAAIGYMQVHLGEPKGESYWLGFVLLICNGLLMLASRAPDNKIREWQSSDGQGSDDHRK